MYVPLAHSAFSYFTGPLLDKIFNIIRLFLGSSTNVFRVHLTLYTITIYSLTALNQ